MPFSRDGSLLATIDEDHIIRLWDADTGRLERTLQGHRYTVYCVAFDPTGQWLATGSEDQEIQLWDVATGEARAPFKGHTGPVYGVAFSPDGRLLASAGGDDTVRLWNPQTGECGWLADEGPCRSGLWCCLQPRRPPAGLRRARQDVRLWDPVTGAPRAS